MSTPLKIIKESSWLPLFGKYFTWLGFTSALFILTHAFSALNLIQAYRFGVLDIFFTFGFLILVGFVETVLLTLIVTGLHLGIQKYFRADPSAVFRLLVLAWFGLSWLNLLLALFNRSLFL
jgi:hypothetical protein